MPARLELDRIVGAPHPARDATGAQMANDVDDVPVTVAEDDVDRKAHPERVHLPRALEHKRSFRRLGGAEKPARSFGERGGALDRRGDELTGRLEYEPVGHVK